jgi:class 3 adenylate cyclase
VPERPTGTVTFLFTDVEGSTKLWEQHPAAMKVAVARHDAILRSAVEAHLGYVVKTTGDGLLAAFATAHAALAAAVQAQRSLLAETWSEIGSLGARMGLHTGPAEERAGDYFGPALNRTARLMAAGHGGQILLTQATYELVRDDVVPEIALRDLGEQRLKERRCLPLRPQICKAAGTMLFPIERTILDRSVAELRTQLSAASFNAAWAEGGAMTLEQAVAFALDAMPLAAQHSGG